MVKVPPELQSQNVGTGILDAGTVQVSEACEICVSGKIDDHEVGGEVEDLDEHDENLETKEVLHIQQDRTNTRRHREIFVSIGSRSPALCISYIFFGLSACVYL